MLKLEWTCDECGKVIVNETKPVSDSYEVYHPDDVHWTSSNGEEKELCDECHAKWEEKINLENPEAVWIA